jgi:hypothetical protein
MEGELVNRCRTLSYLMLVVYGICRTSLGKIVLRENGQQLAQARSL